MDDKKETTAVYDNETTLGPVSVKYNEDNIYRHIKIEYKKVNIPEITVLKNKKSTVHYHKDSYRIDVHSYHDRNMTLKVFIIHNDQHKYQVHMN